MCRGTIVDGGHYFEKNFIVEALDEILNRTLEEIDVANVFSRVGERDKGIAGKIIEQSVLGLPADCRPNPDLNIDGVLTELKTTGMRIQRRPTLEYKAKEPVSVTGVSPNIIINEEFDDSRFWHKLAQLLFVYYHYNVAGKATIDEYKRFPIKGYEFFSPDENMKERLKNDWLLVKNRILEMQQEYENPEEEYNHLSADLRGQLMMVDLVPRERPRFRLKNSVITSIIQEHFCGQLEQLPGRYTTLNDIDLQCRRLTEQYGGKTIEEILRGLGIDMPEGYSDKSIGEKVVIKMFGGQARRLNQIEVFSQAGIRCKTITLSDQGARTEDTKLCIMDIEEIRNDDINFEDSFLFRYFNEPQFMCIIFQEPYKGAALKDNIFRGFKRVSFDEDFIDNEVKPVWDRLRLLVNGNQLREEICFYEGAPVVNRTGVVKTQLNFPKSSEGKVFVRGSGSDSTRKPWNINGIDMYAQYIWIKGKTIVNMLEDIDYL